jgi:hypothetical protein
LSVILLISARPLFAIAPSVGDFFFEVLLFAEGFELCCLLSFFCWDLKKWLTFNYTFFANLEKRG